MAFTFFSNHKVQIESAHYKVTSQVNMDVSIDNEPIGQLTIGLFGEDSPKTVENFRQICINGINGKTYAGTNFHRIIDKLIIQGQHTNIPF